MHFCRQYLCHRRDITDLLCCCSQRYIDCLVPIPCITPSNHMSRMLQGIERHLQLWQEVRRLTGAARNVVAMNQSERCIVQLASVSVSKVLLGCFPVVLSVSPNFNVRVRGVGVVLHAAHN